MTDAELIEAAIAKGKVRKIKAGKTSGGNRRIGSASLNAALDFIKDEAAVFAREQDRKAGFIYVIGWCDDGPLKIGISKDPSTRLASLQTACPYKLRLYKSLHVSDAESVEAEIHSYFNARQTNAKNEWFHVNGLDAKRIVESIAKRFKTP